MSDSKKRDSDWASARARVRAHTLTRRGKGARDGEEGREKEGGIIALETVSGKILINKAVPWPVYALLWLGFLPEP